jgi:hypothetical protein
MENASPDGWVLIAMNQYASSSRPTPEKKIPTKKKLTPFSFSDNYKLYGNHSSLNTYVGGVYQQSTSGLAITNQVGFECGRSKQGS